MEPITCPNCGHPNDHAGATNCVNCGGRLPGAAAGDETAPEVTPVGVPDRGAAAAAGAGGYGGAGGAGGYGAAGGAGGAAPPPGGSSVPFEDTSQPFFQRFFATVGMAFSNPMQLFSAMGSGDLAMPLLYGVLTGTVTAVFSILWNMVFSGMALLGGGGAEEFAVSTGMYILFMFICPLFVVVGLFISSALYHVALMILGDGQRGFSTTFRAVAYGQTPNLLAVVPICGGLVGGLWAIVLQIIGGKQGHDTEWWKAILGYFLPTLVCCCLIFWLLSMFGFLGALAD